MLINHPDQSETLLRSYGPKETWYAWDLENFGEHFGDQIFCGPVIVRNLRRPVIGQIWTAESHRTNA